MHLLKLVFIAFIIFIGARFLVPHTATKVKMLGSKPTQLRINFFDVGQGDAALITTPNGKKILVDGGPSYEIDEFIFRETSPINCHLDVVILSHPHFDHLNGLNRVLQRCNVATIIFPDVIYESKVYFDWKKLVEDEKATVLTMYSNDTYVVDNIALHFVWPSREYIHKHHYKDNLNNASLVFLLDYGELEALFPGDAELEALAQIDVSLLDKYIDGELEVLKFAHHGSRTGLDKKLITALKPEIIILSLGKGNRYGHPHQETLDFLTTLPTKVYRTDLNGEIEVIL